MRIVAIATILLGSVLAVSAQPAAAPTAGTAAAMKTFDIPMTGKPQTYHMLHRVFKPGEDIGFHTHQGTEISWVVRGQIELRIRGGKSITYKAGESFFEPPGSRHLVSENASEKEPATLLAVHVADDGEHLTTFDK